MKKWKKFLSAGLCAILLLGAAACGSDSSRSDMALQGYTNGVAASPSKSATRAADYGYATDSFSSY